jgi:folate-dependent tRNA-U54 methylase TrmFO/GidA
MKVVFNQLHRRDLVAAMTLVGLAALATTTTIGLVAAVAVATASHSETIAIAIATTATIGLVAAVAVTTTAAYSGSSIIRFSSI